MEKFRSNVPNNTRLAPEIGLRTTDRVKSDLKKHSFVNRTLEEWKKLPTDMKKEASPTEFKKKLKIYVKANYQILISNFFYASVETKVIVLNMKDK